MPFARATGIGSTAAWADHSKRVWRRQVSTICSPVIGSAVVVIMFWMLTKSDVIDKLYPQITQILLICVICGQHDRHHARTNPGNRTHHPSTHPPHANSRSRRRGLWTGFDQGHT